MPVEGENDDIRGDLLAAVNSIETATPGSTGSMAGIAAERAAPKGAEESPAVANGSPPSAPAGDKDRDEKGKFVPRVAETKSVEAKPSAEKTAEKPLEEAKPGAEGDKPDAAPGSLPGILKQKWATLDPDAKKHISAMEQKLATQAGTLGDQLKQAKNQIDELEPALGPRRHALIANYGSVGKAVTHLFNLSDFASKDAPGFIAWFAQQSGIDLNALTQGGQQQAPAQAATQLPPELLQRIAGLESRFQQTEQQQQESRLSNDAAEIGSVATEKDAQGNFVRPYFEDLRPQIGPLLSIVRRENPGMSVRDVAAEAYDRAVWANKDTRAQMMQASVSREAEDKAAAARAEAARRAGKSTFGDPPNRFNAPAAEAGSVRDDISKAVYAQMGGGARL